MGGVLPTAAMSVLQMGFEAAQKSNQAAAQKADARGQTEQIRQTQQIEERQKRDRLRRTLATQRARFGAQGIGVGGSSQAVLAGLAAEAEQQNADSRALAATRINRINDQLAWSRRTNLLEASRPGNRMAFGLLQQGFRNLPLLEI
jgi:hypothetical protein